MKKHALRLQRVFLVWSVPAAREHSERVIERRDDSAEIFARRLFRARESLARGVDFSPSTHMATGMARMAGPLVSVRVPAAQEPLTVRMTA